MDASDIYSHCQLFTSLAIYISRDTYPARIYKLLHLLAESLRTFSRKQFPRDYGPSFANRFYQSLGYCLSSSACICPDPFPGSFRGHPETDKRQFFKSLRNRKDRSEGSKCFASARFRTETFTCRAIDTRTNTR
jgi:hypothetical protein